MIFYFDKNNDKRITVLNITEMLVDIESQVLPICVGYLG